MNGPLTSLAKALSGFALVLLATPAGAQDFHVRHYTIDDGLPSSHIQDIAQDAEGRMWFATRSGIAVYDGTDWTVYNLTHGLTWTNIFALRWDAGGVPWSVSSAHPFRVSHLAGEKWLSYFEPPELDADAWITAFAVAGAAEDRRVAVGTNRGLLVGDGGRWRRYDAAHGLPADEVTALVARRGTAGDSLVIATSGGLAELRGGEIVTALDAALPEGDRALVALAPEGAGRLWVLGRDWIGRFDERRFSLVADGLPLPAPVAAAPRVAVADRRGGLYLGDSQGFFHFDPERGLEPLGRDDGLLSEGVTALYLDREDVLWVGSQRGLSKISDRRFRTYNLRHGLLEDEVTAVVERRGGGIVLAHPRGVTFLEQRGAGTLALARGRSFSRRLDRIRDLAEDERGNLWVPTQGLARVEPSGRVSWYGEEEGLPGAVASVVAAGGSLWAATDAGLFVKRGARFEPVSPGAAPMSIRRIFARGGGALLLATDAGLYRYSAAGWRRWTCAGASVAGGGGAGGSVACNSVFAVMEMPGGALWAGTNAGLYRARGDRLVKETSPALDRPIYFIVRDARSRFWFGIDNGVVRWDGARLERFTVQDGLAGRETNRAAGLVDSRGRVWIGTERGVTVYTEDPRKPPRAPPMVMLTDLEAAGERLPLSQPLRLAYDDNDVVFRFRAVSFVDEKRLRVAWRLEDFDPKWSEPQTFPRQEIRYTNLPPGSYRLHVKAMNAEGTWSGVVTSAPVVVARPYWQQPWFFVAAALVLAATLYLVQSHAAQKRYARRLEIEVEERVGQLRKVEAELAKSQKLDAIGLLAGGIAHDFNNFLTVLMGNLSLLALPGRSQKARSEDLKDAQGAILRASKLTQQLLTFSRGGAPVRKAASIAEVIAESASFVLAGSKVRCEIDLPDDLHVVEIDADQIHQLMNNLLINATQAMPGGGTVTIAGRNVYGPPPGLVDSAPSLPKAAPASRWVAIDVIDRGSGIAKQDQTRIFDPYFTTKTDGRGMGLASAYSIAKRHEGLLSVESEPGRGATFTLFLPASVSPLPELETAEGEPITGAGRVLVMDDEESVRRVTGAIVEGLGYEAAYAADGDEAVELYRESMLEGRPFDAVIMDLTIPGGMGGQEAVRHLLELDSSVTAIVVSGYSNDPVMASYREFGFRGMLTKPFRTRDLAELLREVIREGRVESVAP